MKRSTRKQKKMNYEFLIQIVGKSRRVLLLFGLTENHGLVPEMIPLTRLSCCYFFNDGSVGLYNVLTLKHSQDQRNRLVHLHMLETQVQG